MFVKQVLRMKRYIEEVILFLKLNAAFFLRLLLCQNNDLKTGCVTSNLVTEILPKLPIRVISLEDKNETPHKKTKKKQKISVTVPE